ncbi:MAG TPA: PDZ domain-containing protein [Xanthomonadales bacterium]|nr:PDZ domain-containing protein [Xanthomonadales bacterium]
MRNTQFIRPALAAALLASTCAVAAQGAAGTVATQLPTVTATTPDAMLRGELRNVLVRMIDSGAFAGTSPEDISMSVTMPAEHAVDLGAVLDARSEGLVVLGTTPGGTAQSLGLRAQDVIVAANGADLTGAGRSSTGDSLAAAALRGQLERLRDGGRLELAVLRDGARTTLAGDVAPRYIPALRLELGEGALVASNAGVALPARVAQAAPAQVGGCGRISVFHIAPRGQQLYRAKVLEIDGEIPGPTNQDTWRVSPGRHTLRVAELIDTNDLPGVYTRARRHKDKDLVVEVAPDTTLLIAAHLELDNERDVPGNGYWTPVVWKEISEPCR